MILCQKLVLLATVLGPVVAAQPVSYYPEDDASWAIQSDTLSDTLDGHMQQRYDEFMDGCDDAVVKANPGAFRKCQQEEMNRFKMNRYQPPSVYNYTKLGYAKIRAPKELFELILDFYHKNRHNDETEWSSINTYHNMWDSPPTIVHLNQGKFDGGGAHLQTAIWNVAQPLMEEWTGQELSPVSLYGIRLYHNGSILAPHVDRMPLVTSAIINVDQDVNEPWPLEVYGHDRKATNITMEPGDMVLYESHSVIHGRPFPFNGKFFANVFIHFEPIGPLDPNGLHPYDPERDIPPYIVPDSIWETEWKLANPRGWAGVKFKDAVGAAKRGEKAVLQKIGKTNPALLHIPDDLGWTPLHEAVRAGHVEAVQLLLLAGADINQLTYDKVSPLYIARQFLGDDHAMTKFLVELGANYIRPESTASEL